MIHALAVVRDRLSNALHRRGWTASRQPASSLSFAVLIQWHAHTRYRKVCLMFWRRVYQYERLG